MLFSVLVERSVYSKVSYESNEYFAFILYERTVINYKTYVLLYSSTMSFILNWTLPFIYSLMISTYVSRNMLE
jgi:hypothetical protein